VAGGRGCEFELVAVVVVVVAMLIDFYCLNILRVT
jgi:hypothetical protein